MSSFIRDAHLAIDPQVRDYRAIAVRGLDALNLQGELQAPEGMRIIPLK